MSTLNRRQARPSDRAPRTASAGVSLVELSIAAAILGVVLLIGFGVVIRERRMERTTVAVGVAETQAQEMLNRLERALSDARGEVPVATIATAVSGSDVGQIQVDTTAGFPDQGTLLIERGTGNVEHVVYAALGAGGTSFDTLVRGTDCTNAGAHAADVEILWAGLAEVIALQGVPPPSEYDGRASEPEGTVYFRGDGTGFSYRVPTDPAGGEDVLHDGEIRWGAVAGGTQRLTGWAALVFTPQSIFSEAEIGLDVNHDGDETDLYDVGQIRARAWDTADPALPASDIGLGPAAVLQERCNAGGDLDGDGLDDPIFLWDPARRRLHVRLFVLGRSGGERPAVRKVESMIFLRNEVGT